MDGRGEAVSVVTGAFGFSGKSIARRLLAMGLRVRTLTNHARRTLPVEVAPLHFHKPQELADSMAGAAVLYNTYWVRFAYRGVSHERAVENTGILVRAAEQAGVKRIVHISVLNPSADSTLPYFKGKAAAEDIITSSSLSYAILRPAVVFGEEDILINNIAWLLRRFPVFAIPGRGQYGLQPIFVEDLSALAVDCGQVSENLVMDAVGPETYAYSDLVELIGRAVKGRSRVFHAPASFVRLASWSLGYLVDDVLLTKEEVSGLMANLLVSKQPPTGSTSLREWLLGHADAVGIRYASEIERHYRASVSPNGQFGA
jgi:uncharacterized protein YbjT (DUF2867 family)